VDPALRPEDLAPGDRVVAARDWSDLAVARIAGADHPEFAAAYAALWSTFGASGGMEREEVVRERLAWNPLQPPLPGFALAYDLLVLHRGARRVALRDHSAAVRVDGAGRPRPGPVVVHLSHAFVAPAARGSGLAAWLRALPLATARRCAAAVGADDAPVVLAAEMEAPDPDDAATGVRLRSYERAGFRKIDPAAAPYAQPDFRAPEVIARDAPRPVPLSLVVRRVGREEEASMPASEVAAVVEALYAVYAVHVPDAALAPLRAAAREWVTRAESFHLLLPTS
jgi:GNAT superfamily N-acetyltransferase